jgi:DNA-binding CsgD family transcriptional regulator
MAVHEALKELSTQLSLAASAEDIGHALLRVSRRFGLKEALILDVTKLFNRVGPALIFATHPRDAVEAFDARRPFASHPIIERARASERPFLLSSLRKALGPGNDERWWAIMPDSLRGADGIVVPVHDDDELAWCAAFAGHDADLSQAVQSVMGAAVHAGYSLFKKLVEARAPQSPLSARESECLRWVADGKTDAEVGKILKISPRTVRFHINNAKTKLGVATRIQAVAKRISGAA